MEYCKYVLFCILIIVLIFNVELVEISKDMKANSKVNFPYHGIHFIDSVTGNGIPMIIIQSTYKTRYISDSNGYIAFFEPGLMNLSISFTIEDAAGYHAKVDAWTNLELIQIQTTSGEESIVKLNRTQISERWCRLTGYGIYRDSVLLGKESPSEYSLAQKLVTGLDSMMGTFYNGKYYWFFGDTNRVDRQLGNFFVTGAISNLEDLNFENKSIPLNYISDDEFVKSLARIEPLNQPTWIHDVVVIPSDNIIHNNKGMRLNHDKSNSETMYATYYKPETSTLQVSRGILKWNNNLQIFELITSIQDNVNVWPIDGGHAYKMDEWIYFSNPYPYVRTTNYEDFTQYETFSPLIEGTKAYSNSKEFLLNKFERDQNGRLVWGWKKNTGYLSPSVAKQLYDLHILSDNDIQHWTMKDIQTGKIVWPHAGSITWNKFLNQFIMVYVQIWGEPSLLGEIYFAMSPSLVGSWIQTIKIATHIKQDFYNPRILHEFMSQDQKIIYYLGTYVATFSGNLPTPYYDYNNQVHRLDLSDKRIQLLDQNTK